MLRNKLIFHSINIILVILFQSVIQTLVRVNDSSVLLYLSLIISNIIFFDFVEAIIVNLILIVVFCSIFSNGILLNLLMMIFLAVINKRLREKIYVERIEIFLMYLFGFVLIINTMYYLISMILNRTFINPSMLFNVVFTQFILSSILGIFIYQAVFKESKYLERLKKGRNLIEE